ncbi:hypothetical protein AFLA_012978 [Aspergillus flavus NRRL3357]|nr:hypothetical protein AFLA_012978 [Aspergillus flavus NRRL3357]
MDQVYMSTIGALEARYLHAFTERKQTTAAVCFTVYSQTQRTEHSYGCASVKQNLWTSVISYSTSTGPAMN